MRLSLLLGILSLLVGCRTTGSQLKDWSQVKGMTRNADGTWNITCASGHLEERVSDRDVQEEYFCHKNRSFQDFCENSRSVYDQNAMTALKLVLGATNCEQIAAAANTDKLDLNELDADSIISLNFLAYFNQLKVLIIGNRSVRSYYPVGQLKTLEHLVIVVSSPLDAADIKSLQLKTLELHEGSLANAPELKYQTQLEELVLYQISPLASLDFVAPMKGLRKFILERGLAEPESLPIGVLQDLTQLQEISLVGNRLITLDALDFRKLPRLRKLNLTNNRLNNLESIRAPQIEELNVEYNSMSSLKGHEALLKLKLLKGVGKNSELSADIKALRARGVEVRDF